MPKPWRTLIEPKETGRFTREQIQEAVRIVMERAEKRAARERKRSADSAEQASGDGDVRTSKKRGNR
jgi:hypothetical protein